MTATAKLTRTRGHVVNMGNYESLRTEATVELNVEVPEGTMAFTREQFNSADKILSEALARDLRESGALTNVEDSYILSWDGHGNEKED